MLIEMALNAPGLLENASTLLRWGAISRVEKANAIIMSTFTATDTHGIPSTHWEVADDSR